MEVQFSTKVSQHSATFKKQISLRRTAVLRVAGAVLTKSRVQLVASNNTSSLCSAVATQK